MRKAILHAMALACLFLAIGCDTEPADDSKKDPEAKVSETTVTATLDTASGSAIPAQFNADIAWSIKDADWKADDAYVAQAWFAGADADKTPVAIGSPFTFEKTQTGTGKYSFKIPEAGLPATVKKPYELTITVKRCDADFWKSDAWTFTEGKISGVYTGTLYDYKKLNPATDEDVNFYDFQATLTQYGDMVIATDIYYLQNLDDDDPDNDKKTAQTCTVVMTAKTESGKTKLTGTGTYTNATTKETSSYSGEAFVYGDGRTLSCEAYWHSEDTTKAVWGGFDADMKGDASISGRVSIEPNGMKPSTSLFDTASDGGCYAVVLYGFGESDPESNAGRMSFGKAKRDDTTKEWYYDFSIADLPAGNYYLMFGGIDGEDGVPEIEKDHMPWSEGEAVGIAGLDPESAIRWIDGAATQADKDAIAKLVPITVKAGDKLTGKDFAGILRDSNKGE